MTPGISFNLINTPLLLQLIYNEGNIYVLEFSARIGGGSKYKLIETLSGVDILGGYVDLILGGQPIVYPKRVVKYALMNYIYCDPGVVCSIENLEKLEKENIIVNSFQYKSLGEKVKSMETSSDRVAGFLITYRA